VGVSQFAPTQKPECERVSLSYAFDFPAAAVITFPRKTLSSKTIWCRFSKAICNNLIKVNSRRVELKEIIKGLSVKCADLFAFEEPVFRELRLRYDLTRLIVS
jgi:hypothetical protein